MEVFYLKINRPAQTTWHYLKMWLDITQEFPETKTYIVCDNPNLQASITNQLRTGGGYDVEFIPSARDSEELKYIVDNAIFEIWQPAAYAHLTTFLHASDNGYKDFWNIDADDIELCAKPRRIAKLLKHVKDYADNHEIKLFSLDIWRTLELKGHWSFGVVYTNNRQKWIDLMKNHCKDKNLLDDYKNVSSNINIDWFCTYLKEIEATEIETFCVENLRIIHNIDDIHAKAVFGLKYWKKSRSYFSIAGDYFHNEEEGSLPVPKDIVNFDIGITDEECRQHLKRNCVTKRFIQIFETINNLTDAEITIILPVDGGTVNIHPCLLNLLKQTYTNDLAVSAFSPTVKDECKKIFQSFRLIVTDAGINESALKICRETEDKFEWRMKIITGLKKENLLSAGLQAAKGRYVMFINGNDIFIPQALQFLHNVAEVVRADVIHTSNYFVRKNDTVVVATDENGWDDSTDLTRLRSVKERVSAWTDEMISPSVFNKLIRREFLEEEKISLPFADVMTQWTFSLQCLILAENYFRVRQPVYVRTAENPPPNFTKDFSAQIKSLAKCYDAFDKLDEEVFCFDEYADEKILLKNLFNKQKFFK